MLSATECAASDSSAGDPATNPPTALAAAITRLAARATSTVTRVLRSAFRSVFSSPPVPLTKARLPRPARITPRLAGGRQCRPAKSGNAYTRGRFEGAGPVEETDATHGPTDSDGGRKAGA
ncbi:hypothetical protein GCM10010095_01370 [Streptomyces anthocyanicus]|uniref:Uncharacterized protein n=1 Tax=Streptomyces violaceolatus TaxID=67378 RepID=A0ABN3S4I6_9ACTN|nr:hypothetical protein JCM4020_07650 [Streptomyces coelicolor]BDE37485.1 hypothetical protein SLITK23_07300 [Streptomyces lividans]GGL20312.1 hypothetical protein GCM10010095_01370 [Streptomyces anthocyanicus]GHA25270.1 hypothetical protein GCM10010391_06060 [Streptomyces anthocyanicus]GHB91410.1 hypothetical protein GCM10010348_07070 [Streptomyces anthocyanicus]